MKRALMIAFLGLISVTMANATDLLWSIQATSPKADCESNTIIFEIQVKNMGTFSPLGPEWTGSMTYNAELMDFPKFEDNKKFTYSMQAGRGEMQFKIKAGPAFSAPVGSSWQKVGTVEFEIVNDLAINPRVSYDWHFKKYVQVPEDVEYMPVTSVGMSVYDLCNFGIVDETNISLEQHGGDASLVWKVDEDLSVKKFVIESALTKDKNQFHIEFTPIETLKAKGRSREYSVFLNTLPKGYNYFRVKQITSDGDYEYTELVSVFID